MSIRNVTPSLAHEINQLTEWQRDLFTGKPNGKIISSVITDFFRLIRY